MQVPVLFVSHGAPTLTIEDIPARQFLVELGNQYRTCTGRYLCISAHWNTVRPAVSSPALNSTIHDFYGFPPELYRIDTRPRAAPRLPGGWPLSSGEPALPATPIPARGLDHGAWVPVRLMYPGADVPVVQLLNPAQP